LYEAGERVNCLEDQGGAKGDCLEVMGPSIDARSGVWLERLKAARISSSDFWHESLVWHIYVPVPFITFVPLPFLTWRPLPDLLFYEVFVSEDVPPRAPTSVRVGVRVEGVWGN